MDTTKPVPIVNRVVFVLICYTVVLTGWVAYLQYDVRQSNTAAPLVQERISRLEASTEITLQSLQINCNGNDSFTVLSSNAFAQARFCLLPNPVEATLPDQFINGTVYGNTTEVDVMNDTYYAFQGITNIPDRTPIYFISTRFDRLCGYYSTQLYPNDFVWCIPLSNLVCGRSNLVQAQFETAPTKTVTIDVELGFSAEACAVFTTPAPAPEPTPAPTPAPTPEPTPAPEP